MNWIQIIANIQELGNLTHSAIAAECGTAKTTIGSLNTRPGSEPRHSLGEKLLALHKKCQRKAAKKTAVARCAPTA